MAGRLATRPVRVSLPVLWRLEQMTPALPSQEAVPQPEQFCNQHARRGEGEREDGHGGLELPEEEPDRDRLGILQGKDHDEQKNDGQNNQVQH